MVADGLLTRQRYREVPPRVDYELTERSRDLTDVLGALARWGYQWAWGAPRRGEEINIGAVLRLAPGVLRLPADAEGSVELAVYADDDPADVRAYLLTTRQGRVTITEPAPGDADARVSGTASAWVAALGPAGDPGRLELTGARRLAELVLDGFAGVSRSRAAAA